MNTGADIKSQIEYALSLNPTGEICYEDIRDKCFTFFDFTDYMERQVNAGVFVEVVRGYYKRPKKRKTEKYL